MFDSVFSEYAGPPFGVRLWDGWRWSAGDPARCRCTLIFHSADGLESLLIHPSEITLGSSFLAGELDVEGDLFVAFEIAQYVFERPQGRRLKSMETLERLVASAVDWLKRGRVHSLERDRRAIASHYDQPVGFFRPWLGESLVYSCAYFEAAEENLDSAQTNKLDLVCRKLRLTHEDRFLDIGCGWGSMVLHAASRHDVYCQGVTISREQANVADARIKAAEMTQSCRVDLLDYRRAASQFAPFDKIASLGMFEHVGVRHLPEYFRTVRGMLKPGGVFLNHGIARAPLRRDAEIAGVAGWLERLATHVPLVRRANSSSFIAKYVFPDGELATLSEALTAAEDAGFEVRDVENLREHYELTLRAWVGNLMRCKEQIVKQYSETAYRLWLLYMAGSAAAFHRGELAIYQVLLYRPKVGERAFPLTRSDWYERRGREAQPIATATQ